MICQISCLIWAELNHAYALTEQQIWRFNCLIIFKSHYSVKKNIHEKSFTFELIALIFFKHMENPSKTVPWKNIKSFLEKKSFQQFFFFQFLEKLEQNSNLVLYSSGNSKRRFDTKWFSVLLRFSTKLSNLEMIRRCFLKTLLSWMLALDYRCQLKFQKKIESKDFLAIICKVCEFCARTEIWVLKWANRAKLLLSYWDHLSTGETTNTRAVQLITANRCCAPV